MRPGWILVLLTLLRVTHLQAENRGLRYHELLTGAEDLGVGPGVQLRL